MRGHEAFVIAVDGPAASGKGTLARKLAAHYELPYLDTGSLYRAVGFLALRNDEMANFIHSDQPASPRLAKSLEQVAKTLQIDEIPAEKLRDENIGLAASRVAGVDIVRQALLSFQQSFAAGKAGAVLDGRDIGTVVYPGADVKLFITASDEVRAQRRYDELLARSAISGEEFQLSYEDILDDIRRRDQADRQRTVAPLQKADDALLLDTSKLDIETAYESVLQLTENARKK